MTASLSFRGTKVADLKGTAKPRRKPRVTNARQVSGNIWITTLQSNFMSVAEPNSSTAALMKYVDSLLPLQHSQNKYSDPLLWRASSLHNRFNGSNYFPFKNEQL